MLYDNIPLSQLVVRRGRQVGPGAGLSWSWRPPGMALGWGAVGMGWPGDTGGPSALLYVLEDRGSSIDD
jgi:hypothetical protein